MKSGRCFGSGPRTSGSPRRSRVAIAPITVTPSVPPIEREKWTSAVAEPIVSSATVFWTATISTCIASPTPTPATTALRATSPPPVASSIRQTSSSPAASTASPATATAL